MHHGMAPGHLIIEQDDIAGGGTPQKARAANKSLLSARRFEPGGCCHLVFHATQRIAQEAESINKRKLLSELPGMEILAA